MSSGDGGAGVVADSSRLQRPELVERFFSEIVPADIDSATSKAIADAVHDSIETDEPKE